MSATLQREPLPTLDTYARHLRASAQWLLRSVRHGRGGSCAHFGLHAGWSRPYPETTGYLVPTLLRLEPHLPDLPLRPAAERAGRWLLTLQNPDGSWNGGLHPARASRPSVFNTGQILKGLVALHRAGAPGPWLDAARRGARWLATGVGYDGLWTGGDYRSASTPSYYTHVAWPMLEVWSETRESDVRAAAVRVLQALLARRRDNGAFEGWGFGAGERAFTHTIAYTLRGLLESARLLDDWEGYGAPAVQALERMLRKAELAGGRLPGELDLEWRATSRAQCLTGSAQTALNLLLWERRERDLRIVSAAARLVDAVCATQRLDHPIAGVRGAVAGSWPVWGRYMSLRYPNWAAKYHCDALLLLRERVERELEERACAWS